MQNFNLHTHSIYSDGKSQPREIVEDHLVNTIWAIILPSVLSVWNLFMTKTFFESSIPNKLDTPSTPNVSSSAFL